MILVSPVSDPLGGLQGIWTFRLNENWIYFCSHIIFISMINVGSRIKTVKINSFNLHEMMCRETDSLAADPTDRQKTQYVSQCFVATNSLKEGNVLISGHEHTSL